MLELPSGIHSRKHGFGLMAFACITPSFHDINQIQTMSNDRRGRYTGTEILLRKTCEICVSAIDFLEKCSCLPFHFHVPEFNRNGIFTTAARTECYTVLSDTSCSNFRTWPVAGNNLKLSACRKQGRISVFGLQFILQFIQTDQ